MQIIVPMSGFGERFRRAGYTVPKPLIEIDGKPIIAHVVEMFPGETDFIFICNSDHLATPDYRMEEILRQCCPTGRIAAIAPHKLGPVHAVRQVMHLVDPARPVLVNYCDFTCLWDWQHFKHFVAASGCAGAIPAYKGFHPHTLGSTNYAYMREEGGWVRDIQEKQPYTDNRMEEYASSGGYYFASGALMEQAFRDTMEQGLNVGGEYYVSLAYKPLLAQGHKIAVYPLQHFMQWGTPEDVAEYLGWSAAFRALALADGADAANTQNHPDSAGATVPVESTDAAGSADAPPAPVGTLIVPMAGLGQRFANEGYTETKPLIPVSGLPMVLQATADLPAAAHHAFVLRADMPGHDQIAAALRANWPGAVLESVPAVTEGQACTALLGLEALERSLGGRPAPGPVTFGACDFGALYNTQAFRRLADDPQVDVIVWAVRGNANAVRRPQMFGWIDADADGRIRTISVKTPLAAPATDPIVLGTFTFRRAEDFRRATRSLFERDGRINGEFYLDSCINDAIALGLRCAMFEVDSYLSWGTPNDLRTFEYWQSCFSQWHGHPYTLEADRRLPSAARAGLAARYLWVPPALEPQ